MLIKRTPWLYNDSIGLLYRSRMANVSLSVCKQGVMRVFDSPSNVRRVRFCAYDRASKHRVKCELTPEGFIWVGDVLGLELVVSLKGYLSEKAIKKLLDRQKFYYVECEYIPC